ncbi:MAG: cation transporter, partial [Rhizobiales bacterium]|nr:cation transporter [Hyphomicrobiales bacterium]
RIAAALETELHDHLPALDVASIRFDRASEAAADGHPHGHHHAPEPVLVSSRFAVGKLEIVDTPNGERMRLALTQHAKDLQAVVVIDRPDGQAEELPLLHDPGDRHLLLSTAAPAEPHEFEARLVLTQAEEREEIPFRMVEPDHHH